ncbi:MAG TPA: pilus assembly protein [Idiomarina baltica]|uniref:Pilus assembly protein n=1 Tax=Idiomarina baltica TaxID=190892 RepID=A0A348WLS1_9GAMM|nr:MULTISPECIES: pilus assembly protein [Idiomarina]MAF75152.1 pilus assembly protein [Idiomarinaceae bacterium]MBL74423.1 pilus assembly protein [Idiomarinaceae bacterium]HAE89441.1 pilus assembly protein [Idiomarina sp.]HAR55483.1 pilus assembly protein [Idiomarina baltica]|tara:strand:- start:545 stop:835 length:291 start_codon:yes stop_codon:yes gene_type:complete
MCQFNHLTRTQHRQHGQGMTEYIIIVALIAVAAIGVYSMFGQSLRNQVAGLAKEMTGQSASSEINQARQSARTASTVAKKNINLGNYDEANQTEEQ